MARTLDMKLIRYLNLFDKVTGVRTQHCFCYNQIIIFVVPRQMMSKALGEGGKNVKRLSEILEKKVKVISTASGREEIRSFIEAIVYPVKFKDVEIKEEVVIISAGLQSRAALIGRNKTRLFEMKDILQQYFDIKDVKIT